MKIELITEREFLHLQSQIEPAKIKRRDGFCVATVGDTAYVFPEFDYRAFLTDVLTTAIGNRINHTRDNGEVTQAVYRLFKDLAADRQTARAATELMMTLTGKKFGWKPPGGQRFVKEQLELLKGFVIDEY